MTRTNWALVALLIVQLGLAGWLLRPQASAQAVQPLLPDVQADAINRIVVADELSAVELSKKGAQWVAPAVDDYPVPQAGVTRLISDVLGIDTGRLVASTAAAQARLKVAKDDFLRRVEVQTTGGRQYTLYVGTSPTANATHVRLDGQQNVYLASGALAGDAHSDLTAYLDPAYLRVDPNAVTQLEVVNTGAGLAFRRGPDGTWAVEGSKPGETANQAAIQALVQQVATLPLVRPLGSASKPDYALDTPVATASLTISNTDGTAQTVTLDVGAAQDDGNTHVVKASNSVYYVTAATDALQGLLEARHDGYVTAAVPTSGDPAATTGLTSTASLTATLPVTAQVGLTATATVTP